MGTCRTTSWRWWTSALCRASSASSALRHQTNGCELTSLRSARIHELLLHAESTQVIDFSCNSRPRQTAVLCAWLMPADTSLA